MRKWHPKHRSEQRAPGSNATHHDVAGEITHLLHCHKIGQELSSLPKGITGQRLMRKLVAEYGISPGETRKYLRFAREFSKSALDELFAAFRLENFALSFSHIGILLVVKNKADRANLALQAMQGQLPTSALRLLVKKTVRGRSSKGGRPPTLLKLDDAGFEEAINREKEKLRRHLGLALSTRQMRPGLREQLQQLVNHLQ